MRVRFSATSSILATAMSSRPSYRGGRTRAFSDKVPAGISQFVSGDSHFQSVRDANRGRGRVDHHSQPQFNSRFSHSEYRPPQSNSNDHPNQAFRPPAFYNNQQQFQSPQQFQQNQQPRPQFRNPQQQHYQQNQQLRNQKPVDYRNWEYAKNRPSPNCDRFTILSYNILADYLATDHRGKLYFHVPRYMMDWEWRKKNILFELGLWSADILCFQEVDRFHELEKELKVRGYCGIWKMRTGNPVDGCAIFWRSSRFKIMHEESIEFNKLGLRDNVAQICVLERISQNDIKHKSAIPSSTGGSSKVVVGNIHVLFNPRRGEMKLGQVRVLLDRIHAVSKLWDDAPIVLCGDFNCTPKSPLYNFISEQELDLSDLPRDKLSGQASAVIRSPRSYPPNPRTQTENSLTMINDKEGRRIDVPTNNSLHAPTDNRNVVQGETSSNMQKNNDLDGKNGNIPTTQKDFSLSDHINSVRPDSFGLSNDGEHNDERISDSDEAGVHDKKYSDFHIEVGSLDGSEDRHSVHLTETAIHQPPTVHSHHEDSHTNLLSTEEKDLNRASDVSCSELLQSNLCFINDSTPEGSSKHTQALSVTNENNLLPTSHEVKIPNSYAGNGLILDEMEDEAFDKVTESTGSRTPGEDSKAFLSLHGDLCIPSELSQMSGFNSSECLGSTDYDAISELGLHVGDSGMKFNQVDVERTAYDPSAWTPMEIETATGCADSTLVQSPLKLRSTYSEVEDSSGTRDSNGEPLVTSYNRCFLGTVDYIWRSEGLQTVRVLAPLPKHAMQWTDGFPTKKWGSDHIALVSELAFTKDIKGL
ncbi:carbon catabolite repressor protein 4-like [Heracleum sosnowskyi]|uniref:Carbon catabolite repressor protein 4-like n=1 Tax=Heracleum sosnowskyi TaxID=360622 RepID=A0AAD8J1R6_9APIA|nr:carbon catabolite repressor protein 4-like [Heracleum sosnowskyi]